MRQPKKPYDEHLVLQIEQIICDFFQVSIDDIRGYKKESILPTARYSLFYVLHSRYGLSASQIALRYNRTPRVIFRANAQMQHYAQWDAYVIDVFSQLLPLLPPTL